MPNARLSGRSWIASFRGVDGPRQVRIPAKQVPAENTKARKTAAQAYAAECERHAALIRAGSLLYLDHAAAIGAITAQQFAVLRGTPLPEPAPAPNLILTAAAEHPSSRTEPLSAAAWHADLLRRFVAWAGIQRLDQISVELVQRWIEHLVKDGYAWDTRRHALLWIRRACAMAPRQGIPDALAGFRLDRRKVGDRAKIVALDRSELVRLLAALHPERHRVRAYRAGKAIALPDQRPRLAVALGAGMGLRPSETYRLRVKDIDLDRQILSTGQKNEASVRALPLPMLLCGWLAREIEGRRPDELVFSTTSPRGPGQFTPTTWTQWLGPILRKAAGNDALQAKSLRKTFATWAARDRWPAIELEAFLGHESSQVAAITARSYLAEYRVEDLRPSALRINRLLLECLYM